MGLMLAFRAFFKSLGGGPTARRIEQALIGEPDTPALPAAVPEKTPTPKPQLRSEAITLLATLQREARLVDFLMERLDGYSDAQIGAAVRDVQRDSRAVLERLFALEPVQPGEEGSTVTVPAGFDVGCFRLSGAAQGSEAFSGKLAHHGWRAAKCELPQWSGSKEAARVIAPAEVEV